MNFEGNTPKSSMVKMLVKTFVSLLAEVSVVLVLSHFG